MPHSDHPRAKRSSPSGSGRLSDTLMVSPGSRVDLATHDPGATHGHDKADADEELTQGLERLADLQDRLWAEARHSVLVVLQGIDAAGKDGTIAKVMEAFNPQGCPVTSFKVPSPEEVIDDRPPPHPGTGRFDPTRGGR